VTVADSPRASHQRVPDPSPPSASPQAGRAARHLLATAADLVLQARDILHRPDLLVHDVRQHCERVQAALVLERLRATPIEKLREDGEKGLPWKTLYRAGYQTIDQLHGASEAQLQLVHGIGQPTAARLRDAARRHAQQVAEETVVRLRPDRRTSEETHLLQSLAALDQADQTRHQMSEPATRLATQLQEVIHQARRTRSRLRMALTRQHHKAAALAALAQVQALLASHDAHMTQQAAQRAQRQPPAPDALWVDYERRAAHYTTLLSNVMGTSHDDIARAPERGFIPPEIADHVDTVQLDSRLLSVRLRGYQAFGARFALAQQHCILGDEMGLGKTIQAIAAIAHLAAAGSRYALVICPTSVLLNWLREIEAHSSLEPFRLHGPHKERLRQLDTWQERGGVAVTTYGTVSRLPVGRPPATGPPGR
jgi:SNF2 family DNA or RNA helicase